MNFFFRFVLHDKIAVAAFYALMSSVQWNFFFLSRLTFNFLPRNKNAHTHLHGRDEDEGKGEK